MTAASVRRDLAGQGADFYLFDHGDEVVLQAPLGDERHARVGFDVVEARELHRALGVWLEGR